MTISNHGHLTARRIGVGAVTSAVVSGLLLVVNPTSASAATNVTVTTGDIRGDESIYTGWHQGYANAALSAGITSAGLVMKGQSQIIKGYSNSDNEGLATNGVNADLDTVLPGASYDVKAGSAYFQVPLFVDQDDQVNTPPVFTTLRPAVAAISNDTIELADSWISTNTVNGIAEDVAYPLSQILTEIGLHPSKTLAFGVLSDSAGTVGSITWAGTTYTFADAATTTVVKNSDIAAEETSSSYSKWHQGYDGATARQQVTSAGLVLAGKSQVIKGFSNNSPALNNVNANLQFALPDSSYTIAAGSDPVFFQVPVRFNNGSGLQFATLRNTGQSTAGTHGFALTDQWVSSKDLPGIDANTSAPLADIIAALGNYKTIGFGVLTDPGTVGTVSEIKFGAQKYTFNDAPAAATSTSVTRVRDIAANEDTYAGWHQGSETGVASADTDSAVLNLGATRSQVINGYSNNSNSLDARNVNLVDALTNATYSVTGGTVYFQVPMFVEDPISGVTKFTTLRPAQAASNGLNTVDVGQEWVSSQTVGLIQANTPVLLGDILSQFTTYKVIAFGVYSDLGGNGKVSDITWNGVKNTFTGNRTPASAAVTGSTTSGHSVTLPLKGTDADGDAITYTVGTPTKGTAVLTGGSSVTFTAPVGYVGTTTVSYTSTDGTSTPKAGTVTIKVGKVASTLSLKATKGAGKKTFITVKASAPGAIVTGGQVEIKRAGKTVAKGKVAANGSVKLLVGKKLKGTKVFTVTYKGTASATPVTKKISVKIK